MSNLWTLPEMMVDALEKRYDAELVTAMTNLRIYLEHPAGVAEHPDIVNEVDKLVRKIDSVRSLKETLTAMKEEGSKD